MSRRRIGFYERLGFRVYDIHYVQPSYGKGKNPVEMLLISVGNVDLKSNYNAIMADMANVVHIDWESKINNI